MSRTLAGLVAEYARFEGFTDIRFVFDGDLPGVIASKPDCEPVMFTAVENESDYDSEGACRIASNWSEYAGEQVVDVIPLGYVPVSGGWGIRSIR